MIIDVFALDQEHVHSDLERHFISDLINGGLIAIDSSLEGLSVVVLSILGINELSNLSTFIQDPHVVLVDINSSLDNLSVLLDDLADGLFGLIHDLVIFRHNPKVHLVSTRPRVLGSWQVVRLFDNGIDDVFQLRLDVVLKVVLEDDLGTFDG